MSREWPGVARTEWARVDIRRREDSDYDPATATITKATEIAAVATNALVIPPSDAEYLVTATSTGLSAERVLGVGNGLTLDTTVAGAATLATPDYWLTKAADTSRASNSTYAADPDLQFAVATGVYYVMGRLLVVSASTSPDVKVQLTYSASSSVIGSYWSDAGTNTVVTEDSASPAIATTFTLSANVIKLVQFEVMLVAGATGTFAVEWAQNASSSTATTVKAGSFLRYRKTV